MLKNMIPLSFSDTQVSDTQQEYKEKHVPKIQTSFMLGTKNLGNFYFTRTKDPEFVGQLKRKTWGISQGRNSFKADIGTKNIGHTNKKCRIRKTKRGWRTSHLGTHNLNMGLPISSKISKVKLWRQKQN